MSAWLWVLIIAVGWVALALVTALLIGRIIRNAERQRALPADAEPRIPEQRQGPKRRKKPQNWPYKNGHSK